MSRWSEYTEEQRERYKAKSREYKRKNREKVKEQRKEYDKQYYANLTDEQREKKNQYNREYRRKLSEAKPKKVKKVKPKKVKENYAETFPIKANLKHDNKYDYSKVEYVNVRTKVTIICPEHGEFEQRPNDHLTGYGCPKCGGTQQLTTDDFIEKAKTIHGDKYDYSKSEYVKSHIKLTITCPLHGDWSVKPNNHLNGKGCPKCGVDDGTWHYSVWERKGKRSVNFDSFKVYVIKCWNDTETFYKVGKTFKKVKERFKGLMPYNYEVIKIYEGDAKEISLLEQKLNHINKEHSYLPSLEFKGRHECFSKVTLTD